ncbi:hypothetical protein HK104_002061 [Borealophlyctis nickersoniae]|nr:hypothetical protein HK104_002061 [Borealophlyctis nickersoniae]
MKTVTLPTCSAVRHFENDILADVFYYFIPFHGQAILDLIGRLLNDAYSTFITDHPDFSGTVTLFGHSLGGIICYDILANQHRARSPPPLPLHPSTPTTSDATPLNPDPLATPIEVQYPKLDFIPRFLFTPGCPLGAAMIMRGQSLATYPLPPPTTFQNIFHILDPIAYRIEPVLSPAYTDVPPVLLQRPSGAAAMGSALSYYAQWLGSYLPDVRGRVNLSFDFGGYFPELPEIGLPSFVGAYLPDMIAMWGSGDEVGTGEEGEEGKEEEESDVDEGVGTGEEGEESDEVDEGVVNATQQRTATHGTKRSKTHDHDQTEFDDDDDRHLSSGGEGELGIDAASVSHKRQRMRRSSSSSSSSSPSPRRHRKNVPTKGTTSPDPSNATSSPLNNITSLLRTRLVQPVMRRMSFALEDDAIVIPSDSEDDDDAIVISSDDEDEAPHQATLEEDVVDTGTTVVEQVFGGVERVVASEVEGVVQGGKELVEDGKKEEELKGPTPRLDFYLQETVLGNVVHQYLVGLKAHFAYWTNKDMMWHILKQIVDEDTKRKGVCERVDVD